LVRNVRQLAVKRNCFRQNIKCIDEIHKASALTHFIQDRLKQETHFYDFFENPSKEFLSSMFSENNSVLNEIMTSEATPEFRLLENMGVGHVYKFYNGKYIKDIVFFDYGGKKRI